MWLYRLWWCYREEWTWNDNETWGKNEEHIDSSMQETWVADADKIDFVLSSYRSLENKVQQNLGVAVFPKRSSLWQVWFHVHLSGILTNVRSSKTLKPLIALNDLQWFTVSQKKKDRQHDERHESFVLPGWGLKFLLTSKSRNRVWFGVSVWQVLRREKWLVHRVKTICTCTTLYNHVVT